MSGFFDWLDTPAETTLRDRIALREKLNEAKCAEIKARRLDDIAMRKMQEAMNAYLAACEKVRQLEKELKETTQ